MQQQTAEVKKTANPYNKPDTGQASDVERGVVGANDSLAYVAPKKAVVMNPMNPHSSANPDTAEQVTDTKEQEAKQEDTPYRKENFEKRYADARRGHEKYRDQKEKEIAELKKRLRDAGPKFVPPKTPDELATFKEENPDLYATMVSVSALHTESELKNVREELEEVRMEKERASRMAAEASLRSDHPDLDKIRSSEDYALWVDMQPLEIQSWIKGTDPVLASRGLDLYKRDRGISNQQTADNNPEVKVVDVDPAEAVSIPSKPDVDATKVDPNTMVWDSKWVAKLETKRRNPKTNMTDYEEWWNTYGQRALAEGRIR